MTDLPSTSTAPGASADDRTVVLDHGDRSLAYATYGPSDGTPVVLLHGTPGCRLLGRLFEAAAEAADVRVLAPDRPGCGRSDPWPERTVRDAGAVVERVLAAEDTARAGLVAFSGGAPHALATAATRPERVTRVDLVAGATPPAHSEATPAVQRLLAGLATRTPTLLGGLLRGQAWLAARLDPSFVLAQYTSGDAESVPDEVAALVRTEFVEALSAHRQGAVSEFRASLAGWDVDLERVECEVGLWHGDRDGNVPLGDAQRLAAALPHAELQVLEGADHLRTLLWSREAVLARHG